jgi:hypothetical protein
MTCERFSLHTQYCLKRQKLPITLTLKNFLTIFEDLSEEIGKSNTETPWVISKCTEEIENWLKNNRKCLYIMN